MGVSSYMYYKLKGITKYEYILTGLQLAQECIHTVFVNEHYISEIYFIQI